AIFMFSNLVFLPTPCSAAAPQPKLCRHTLNRRPLLKPRTSKFARRPNTCARAASCQRTRTKGSLASGLLEFTRHLLHLVSRRAAAKKHLNFGRISVFPLSRLEAWRTDTFRFE